MINTSKESLLSNTEESMNTGNSDVCLENIGGKLGNKETLENIDCIEKSKETQGFNMLLIKRR